MIAPFMFSFPNVRRESARGGTSSRPAWENACVLQRVAYNAARWGSATRAARPAICHWKLSRLGRQTEAEKASRTPAILFRQHTRSTRWRIHFPQFLYVQANRKVPCEIFPFCIFDADRGTWSLLESVPW